MKAKPFIKWAGGKRKLLPHLLRHVPEKFGTYHEPFIGGGALFYELQPKKAYISDANPRLIRTYRGIRDDVEGVIERLQSYPHDKEFFLELRRKDIDFKNDVDMAAWFIYLNRTGFNGLYRVNRDNGFNVPFGDYKNPKICDADNLRTCSKLLRSKDIVLMASDFMWSKRQAEAGDFVYFDPPYLPLKADSFVGYTGGGFGYKEQVDLRNLALVLKKRGVHVLLSNACCPIMYELYGEHFQIEEVLAARAINSAGDKRGPVKEVLIW